MSIGNWLNRLLATLKGWAPAPLCTFDTKDDLYHPFSPRATCAAFSPAGDRIAAGNSEYRGITLFDLTQLRILQRIEPYRLAPLADRSDLYSSIRALDFSADGNLLAFATFSALGLLSTDTSPKLLASQRLEECTLKFSPGADTLVTVGQYGGRITIWSARSEKPLEVLREFPIPADVTLSRMNPRHFALSPDGQCLALSVCRRDEKHSAALAEGLEQALEQVAKGQSPNFRLPTVALQLVDLTTGRVVLESAERHTLPMASSTTTVSGIT